MKVAGVVGPGADEIARRFVAEFGARGRVARVRRDDATTDGGALITEDDADTSYVLSESGSASRVIGPPRTLGAVLDDLAPTHDYAIVTGHPEARIPYVVVGDVEFDGEVAARLDGGASARSDDGATDAATGEPAGSIEDAIDAIESTEPHETVESLVARAKAAPEADRAGAVATFTGRVRERDDPDDPRTTELEFETYEGVAEERMAAISEELEARDGVFRVLMHHRTGVVEAGEDIVFVVVLAGHREEAFATVSDGIDRLKAEVPIFKKEVTVDGELWAHERE